VSAVDEFTEEYVLNLSKKAYEEGVASFEIIREKCALLVSKDVAGTMA
jgi:hypothetical protein